VPPYKILLLQQPDAWDLCTPEVEDKKINNKDRVWSWEEAVLAYFLIFYWSQQSVTWIIFKVGPPEHNTLH
jgi:hypothetical protein